MSWLKRPRELFARARARFAKSDAAAADASATAADAVDDAEADAATKAEAAALAPHLELGRRGEALAADYLLARGYRLVASNFKLNVGRDRRGAVVQAELDLVAYDGPVLCFVEVKTRASDWFAAPQANVDLRKQRQVTRAARAYRRLLGLAGAPHRYDVVTVVLPSKAAGSREPAPRVELLRNFWTESKFRKRRWSGF